ncbi:hypothetical protein [Streptomyces sp. NPDC051909]|uniref:hypothetical protein n=1 Tax=Streptomyces sp. NPDC051909 TaxID=3154944 RepID=UPI003431BC3F
MHPTPSSPPGPLPTTERPPPTPESDFDALYVSTVPGLTQQAYVLTGSRSLAFESAEQAFHRAWEHWPEVAHDPDPAGWVRARAHEYALSPWHRLRPGLSRAHPSPADPVTRALLTLPPWQRRTLLLCDGLDLSVEEAAAETQATTYATTRRLRNARAALSRQVPDDASGSPREALRTRVKDASVATLAQPWSVRAASERRARAVARAVFGATAILIALVTATSALSSAPGGTMDDSRPPRQVTTTAGE